MQKNIFDELNVDFGSPSQLRWTRAAEWRGDLALLTPTADQLGFASPFYVHPIFELE